MDQDVRWYLGTLHECQVRLLTNIHIPPTVKPCNIILKSLHQSTSTPSSCCESEDRYVVHTRYSLSSCAAWGMLRRETGSTVGVFIFQEMTCQWSAIEEIRTDNHTLFVKAYKYLVKTYGIHHIRVSHTILMCKEQLNDAISMYENVRKSLIKAVDGSENRWHINLALCSKALLTLLHCTLRRSVVSIRPHGSDQYGSNTFTFYAPLSHAPFSSSTSIWVRSVALSPRIEHSSLFR